VTGFNLFLRQALPAYEPGDRNADGDRGDETPTKELLVIQIPATSINRGLLVPLGR